MKKMETRWGIMLAILGILGYFLWNFGPMVASFFLAFTDWGIAGTPNFIGIENFKELFDDFIFKKSLWVTFYFGIGSVISSGITAFVAALLLNQSIRFKSLFRTIFFLPAIVPAIANSVIWLWLFNPTFGLLNSILQILKLPTFEWIYNENQVIPSLILMSAWQMGYIMVIFLAGLQGIPQQLYEAVSIDGGNWWHRFRYITIPMMTPTFFFQTVMGLIGALQGFVQPYVMTNGGPNYASTFMVFYIYQNAFRYGKMGYACAISTIFFLIILGLTILIFKTAPFWVYYEAEKGR
ncbi:MAG: sugar ABC transporter permease [Elusimicrobiota bacterium]|nr:sugar ABC transporter permease [Endomicrobiia bacterium]MCX7846395.1 sugar ABC transporter permease [Dictyoglomaceae bacterium]MDW7973299.1 sugar ABC transporter permease [Thermodesulfovibrio sp.]MDW8166509.1 sugar ABC transporter permease [Elusimicrobiota bacterium]